MDRDDFRNRAAALLIAACALGAGACGVHEYPHAQQMIDPNSDFGPSMATAGVGAAGAAGGVSVAPPAGAGTGGVAGVAPPPTAGTGGIGGAGGAGGAGGTAGTPVTPDAGTPDAGTQTEPPRSGVVIELGGEQVAKEDVIAFIHIGHSNMAGRATGPQASRPYFFDEPNPHAWMYHVGKSPEPAAEPYTAGDDLSGVYGGPGTALVKQAAELAPNKHFMSLGYGHTSAYCTQFLPNSLYYDEMMKNVMAIKDRVTFGAIIILLGITERHGTSADITGFSSCINDLVTAIRTDVGRPDLPMLICDYEQEASGALAVTSTFARQITPEIRKIPMVVSNSAIVPTDGLGMQDDHHFNFDGHKEYTRRVLQIMQDKGWFPWAQQ
jgi:hypothetical protein